MFMDLSEPRGQSYELGLVTEARTKLLLALQGPVQMLALCYRKRQDVTKPFVLRSLLSVGSLVKEILQGPVQKWWQLRPAR